jgi:glutathione peroxidase
MGLGALIINAFSSSDSQVANGSIYDFKMKSLDGKEIDFSVYRGKKLLLVNTASKCGKTPQYAHLQRLHKEKGDKVVVLGFPANNFLWQEPGSREDIAEFCERNYGVTFQMFDKISVKGRSQHPLYKWLAAKTGKSPDWNFAKYLVEEDGTTVTFFNSDVKVYEKPIMEKLTP